MLVLSRKHGQEICIGDNILVKVIRVNGGRVRIAIEAPPDVRITRGELLESSLGLPVLPTDSPAAPVHGQ